MIKDTDYAYADARLKANENKLLTTSDIETLVSCRSVKDCYDFLAAKGWKLDETVGLTEALKQQNQELWQLLTESVPDKSVLDVLTVCNDYFNVKAALKASFVGTEADRLFVYPTSVDLEMLQTSVKRHDFDALGERMGNAAREAYQAALTSESGQAADIIIDRAALDALSARSKESQCGLAEDIARLLCTFSDIKTAYRSARTGKSASFLEKAISDGGALDRKTLIEKSEKGENELLDYLQKTDYKKAASLLSKSTVEFEKYCDDAVIEEAKKAKYCFLGFEPVLAFYYAKQAELKCVRIIIGAKQNGLSEEAVRERVRALYG